MFDNQYNSNLNIVFFNRTVHTFPSRVVCFHRPCRAAGGRMGAKNATVQTPCMKTQWNPLECGRQQQRKWRQNTIHMVLHDRCQNGRGKEVREPPLV